MEHQVIVEVLIKSQLFFFIDNCLFSHLLRFLITQVIWGSFWELEYPPNNVEIEVYSEKE